MPAVPAAAALVVVARASGRGAAKPVAVAPAGADAGDRGSDAAGDQESPAR